MNLGPMRIIYQSGANEPQLRKQTEIKQNLFRFDNTALVKSRPLKIKTTIRFRKNLVAYLYKTDNHY